MALIERVRDDFAMPIVDVTHTIEEVRRLASRAVRIVAGRVVDVGTAVEVLGARVPLDCRRRCNLS
jgi:molybdate transport system ATP-binding protein